MTATRRKPPRGWKAWFWRAPILFYRWHMGWMLGNHFLLLNHTGRKSGLPRQAVLEVVDYRDNIYYISSGFGEKAQWFQNIMHTPEVKIQVGRKKYAAHAERLPLPKAAKVLSTYAKEHPRALRELSRVLGLPYDGSEEGFQKLAEMVPIIALHIL